MHAFHLSYTARGMVLRRIIPKLPELAWSPSGAVKVNGNGEGPHEVGFRPVGRRRRIPVYFGGVVKPHCGGAGGALPPAPLLSARPERTRGGASWCAVGSSKKLLPGRAGIFALPLPTRQGALKN